MPDATEEVVEDGISGFLVDDLSEAVGAAERIGEIDRGKVRSAFERRFTIERVATDYMRVYRSLPGFRAVGTVTPETRARTATQRKSYE